MRGTSKESSVSTQKKIWREKLVSQKPGFTKCSYCMEKISVKAECQFAGKHKLAHTRAHACAHTHH